MNSFSFQRPQSIDAAIAQIQVPNSKFIGGGTNLIDLMKGGVEVPGALIDVTALPLDEITEQADGGIMIGALVRNSDVADARPIRQQYPLLAQALLSGASGQLRNMATVGGNLLQRTRCSYFYDVAYAECNKRNVGSGCAARLGSNRGHAIFGASEACVATNPSDMSVALLALDASVRVQGPRGPRDIPMEQFHRLPGDRPQDDTTLQRDELILGVILPRSPFATNFHYQKVRDRASYAFALVSVAAALQLRGTEVVDARLVLGGVAHKPWRVHAAEQALIGRVLSDQSIAEASLAALDGAQPLRDNQFKVKLAQHAVARAVQTAGALS